MDIIDEDLIATEAVPLLSQNEITVSTLRLDQLHPVISGNKWFKLKFHLQNARNSNAKGIITFGGAFSNHIVATAANCAAYSIPSIGIIRGEKPKQYSHTLQTAEEYGMQLFFLSRNEYRRKQIPDTLASSNYYIIPEGGYSKEGADGAATIPYQKETFTHILCAVGTGTMMAGLINGKAPHSHILGISILKNHQALEQEIQHLLKNKNEPIEINHQYHFGGYAKKNTILIDFINELYQNTGITTDFVYTAKLFYAAKDLIQQQYFKPGSRLLLIHSGGLQGNLSLRKGTLIF